MTIKSLPLLEVRHLSKYYYEKDRWFRKKKHLVVDNISFDVYPKEIFAITGNNSCGKSTIAGILAGTIISDEGSINLMNRHLKSSDNIFRRSHIRLANLEQIKTFSLHLTVYEFLAITLEIVNIDKELYETIIVNTLNRLNAVPTLRYKAMGRLNKQEQTLVALAHALILEPEILIIDDLFATLDLSFQAVLINILLDLQKQGFTIILISADLGIIKHISDRVMILQDGVIEDIGTTYDVLNSSNSEFTSRLVKSYFGKSLGPSDWQFSFNQWDD